MFKLLFILFVINLLLYTKKIFSTCPWKSTKLKWASLQKLRMKFFDSVKILSIVLKWYPKIRAEKANIHNVQFRSESTVYLQSVAEHLGLTLVFTWKSALRERFYGYFGGFSASINKIFILAGGMGTGLSFYRV